MPRRGPRTDARARAATGTSGLREVTPPSPPAVRADPARWRDPRLVAGVALVALCAVLGGRVLASADDTVEVWAARFALDRGQQVGAGDLVRREVRFADQADADRYLPATDLPAGARVDREVGAGELLPRAALGKASQASLTEVPLSVGTEAVPSTVRVGSLVDVWVTPDRAEATARSTLVFDDVAVVSVPRTGSSLGPTSTRQVIVGVDAEQSAGLARSIAALAGGDLTLTTQR
ncbi:MAG: hypothetical protein ABI776_06255 [Nocardioidaceae bacterium]